MTDARLTYGVYQQHMRPLVHKSAFAGLVLRCRRLYAGYYAAQRRSWEDEKGPQKSYSSKLPTIEVAWMLPIAEGKKAST